MLAFQIYLTVSLRFPFDLGFEICCGSLVVHYSNYLIGVPSRLWAVVCTCVDNDGSRILMGNNASIKMGLAAMVDVVQAATTSPWRSIGMGLPEEHWVTFLGLHTLKAARQLLEQAPHSPEYVPEDHVPVYIPKPEHPEDLVSAEDAVPTPPLPPFFLSPRIRPPYTRAAMRQMRATAPSTYHSLLPSGTPPLLPIPLPAPSTSRRADIPEADTPPRKRLLLTTPRPGCEVGESSATAAARQPGPTIETRLRDTERRIMTALELVNRRVTYQVDVCTRESSEFCTRHHDAQKDRAAVRAEIEVLRRERLAYEQEGMETRQALARSEAHCRALEARVTVLETEVRRHEWQRQAADDLAVQHIMRTQALEAGARVDTLEDPEEDPADHPADG
ncbi:hypothetical protein Tco_0855576 [Tanacetum coccineum]